MWFLRQWRWCSAHHTAQVTINNETGWSSLVPHLFSHLHVLGGEVKSVVVATGRTTRGSISAPAHRWEHNSNTLFDSHTQSFLTNSILLFFMAKSIFQFTLTSINSINSIVLSEPPRCSFLYPENLSEYSREIKKCLLLLKILDSKQDFFFLTVRQWKHCSFIKKKKKCYLILPEPADLSRVSLFGVNQ